MKFESKYGLGEICVYGGKQSPNESRQMRDQLVKIVSINFYLGSSTGYTVEYVADGVIERIQVLEDMLEGDPDFDQDNGYVE